MDRDTLFVLALASLAVAALTVGISGWVLVVRERRLASASPPLGAHHEVHEER